MTYRSAKLTTEELHEVKHLMGGLLTMLSFWSLLSLDVQSSWLIAAGLLAVSFSLIRPAWVSHIPPFTWRLTAPLLLVVIIADFLLNIPEFIPSLVRMVVLLLLYRNFAPRYQREDLQLILLCLFCLIMSGVMTVSLLFAFQILLFTPMAMALLFVVCLLDRGEQTEKYETSWTHFSWPRLLQRVWQVLDWRVLALGSAMFGFVVLVSTLLFILTPRFNLDQAIPFLQVETQAMTGFSEEVALGDVSAVQNDNAVAIRIDLPSVDALDTQPYWRMLVLDRYLDGRFQMSGSLNSYKFREPMTRRELPGEGLPPRLRRGEEWTFYMEGGISRYLPVPGDYAVLRFQLPQEIELLREPHVYCLDSVSQSVFSYQIEDMQFNTRFQTGRREWQGLEDARPSTRLDSAHYPLTTFELALRPEERASLSEINGGVVQGRDLSASEYSQELTEFLRGNFEYSLRPDGQVLFPNADDATDPVINWLREGSRGHCELFASAFVLLARDAGYPARLVIGFVGGSWNSVEDYFVIRNRDAHAWVEIYDQAAKEWLRVDPTPGTGSSDPEAVNSGNMQFETGWSAWIDSLRIQWYRRIVNFEQKDQVEMAMSLKDMFKAFAEEFSARAKAAVAEFKAWISQPFSVGNLMRGLVAAFFVLFLVLVWRARYAFMGLIFRLLRRPKALDPVRRQASRYLKRLEEKHGEDFKPDVLIELQELRFGPEVGPDQAKAVFARAKKALRSGDRASPDRW
ncbi:transglutaminaseTgpA domain-containing protein [Coraliomargarita sinensis]|nr:DUF3488 and transglutaminase-like domain-containing protein [Coraliomargarita sinensis]